MLEVYLSTLENKINCLVISIVVAELRFVHGVMYVFAVGKKLRETTYIETGAMEKRPSHKQRLQNMCSYLQLVMGFWVKQFTVCLNAASWHGCWYCHSLGSLLYFTDIHNWNCMWHLVRMSKVMGLEADIGKILRYFDRHMQ